jgi:hypothetical protein
MTEMILGNKSVISLGVSDLKNVLNTKFCCIILVVLTKVCGSSAHKPCNSVLECRLTVKAKY